jgi:hypothetical protein
MVGGTAEDFAAALQVLRAMGKTIEHVGPSGRPAGEGSQPAPLLSCAPCDHDAVGALLPHLANVQVEGAASAT